MDTDNEHEKTQRTILVWISLLILALGLTFYLAWGLLYNSWNIFARENLGVYAVTVVMVGFGILGLLINNKKLKELQ